MASRPKPVTVCTNCGTPGYNIQLANEKCGRMVGNERCTGTNRSAIGENGVTNRRGKKSRLYSSPFSPTSVQFKNEINGEFSCMRHQRQALIHDFWILVYSGIDGFGRRSKCPSSTNAPIASKSPETSVCRFGTGINSRGWREVPFSIAMRYRFLRNSGWDDSASIIDSSLIPIRLLANRFVA
jgi:hypothetical protein